MILGFGLMLNSLLIIIFLHFIRNKAFAKLDFLKRTCAHFMNQFSLKTLDQSINSSHFDYALLLWHPYLKSHTVYKV